MWIYVIANADLNNLLTETTILHDFRLRDLSLSESEFILTLFMNAVDSFKKEGGVGSSKQYNSISPHIIFSKTSVPDTSSDSSGGRTQSMMTPRPIKENEGLVGSIKGLFNK
jgi:hypothetical protein